MTTRTWSSLSNGQTIAFDPSGDVLNFDSAGIDAVQVAVTIGATSLSLSNAGKTVTLTMNPHAATHTNITFANGSRLVIGDDATGVANDNAANQIFGNAGNDQLIGLGGDDHLNGGSGNDVLNGGFGNDTAEFSGGSAGYNFRLDGGNVVVTDTDSITGGNDGADRLIRVDAASFTDGTVQVIAPLVGFQVNAGSPDTADRTEWPSVASLTGGGFLIAWTGGFPGEEDCYAQRYDATGAAIGEEFRVNTTTSGDQRASQATGLADGGFVVTWFSPQDGSGTGIYAQRYDASGTAVGPEFRVNTTTASNQYAPAIAAVSDGGFVVTWYSTDADAGDIYAQRYDAGGVALGTEFRVNSTTENPQQTPSIAALSGGGFVVAWDSAYQDGSVDGVYAQRYDASGNAVGSEFRVNTFTANPQDFARIAALPDDGFIVTWTSDVGSPGTELEFAL